MGCRLRQEQRPVWEVERRVRTFLRNVEPLLLPPEPSTDHQVEYEKDPGIELEHDSLAETPHADDYGALGRRRRRLPRPQQRRGTNADLLHPLPYDMGAESVQVGFDLGKFRHAASQNAW